MEQASQPQLLALLLREATDIHWAFASPQLNIKGGALAKMSGANFGFRSPG